MTFSKPTDRGLNRCIYRGNGVSGLKYA